MQTFSAISHFVLDFAVLLSMIKKKKVNKIHQTLWCYHDNITIAL